MNSFNRLFITPRQGSAGFQTCCIADFQIGGVSECERPAGLETCDTADLEVCVAGNRA